MVYTNITLSVTPKQRKALAVLAFEHRCFHGNTPSISLLIKLIARGEIQLISERK